MNYDKLNKILAAKQIRYGTKILNGTKDISKNKATFDKIQIYIYILFPSILSQVFIILLGPESLTLIF